MGRDDGYREGATMARKSRREIIAEGGDRAVGMYLKERVYATFTGLAIVLVVTGDAEADAPHALIALVLGVIGITVAGFVSDIVSHLAVHRSLPDRAELRILGGVAGGALSTVVVPVVLLLLAWAGVLHVHASLRAVTIVYILTLGVIAWLAVRRAELSGGQKLLALAMLIVLGLAVVGLQILAHAV